MWRPIPTAIWIVRHHSRSTSQWCGRNHWPAHWAQNHATWGGLHLPRRSRRTRHARSGSKGRSWEHAWSACHGKLLSWHRATFAWEHALIRWMMHHRRRMPWMMHHCRWTHGGRPHWEARPCHHGRPFAWEITTTWHHPSVAHWAARRRMGGSWRCMCYRRRTTWCYTTATRGLDT